ERARVEVFLFEEAEEFVDAVLAREEDPRVRGCVARGALCGGRIARRTDLDRRDDDGLGAALAEHRRLLLSLIGGARDEDALAGERARVEPAQAVASGDRVADDEEDHAALTEIGNML